MARVDWGSDGGGKVNLTKRPSWDKLYWDLSQYGTEAGANTSAGRQMAENAKMNVWNQTGLPLINQVGMIGGWPYYDFEVNAPEWWNNDTTNGGDGTGSGTEEEPGAGPREPSLPPITWSEKYQASGAPDWWRGLVPSRYDPQTEYATMLNAMMPYMSPEDQRYTASVLYRMYPEQFAGYNPETTKMPPIPGEMTTDERREMTSRRRAKELLGVLEKVKQASGKDAKFGPGYNYLRQLGSVMKDFGGKKEDGQTRQQRAQMVGALDPLVAETQGSQLSAYSALTRMITQPYYTAGEIAPTTQLQNGKTVFGGSIPGYY